MRKDSIRHDVENDRAHRVEGGKCQPKQREQANVCLHSAGTGLGKRDRAYDLLAAVIAEPLTGLYCRAASIAEHDFALHADDFCIAEKSSTPKYTKTTGKSSVRARSCRESYKQNDCKRKGHPATGRPLLKGE
jgi:hypothetical protein